MKSVKYIKLAKEKLNISGYALSQLIGVGTGTLTNYEKERRVMDDYTAFQLAEILEIDPAKIIAEANSDREKDEFKKEFWNEKVKEFGFIDSNLLMVILTTFLFLNPVTFQALTFIFNSPIIYIMRSLIYLIMCSVHS